MEDLTTLKSYAHLKFPFLLSKLPDEGRLDGIKDRGGLGEL